jgi:hypothetical protein
VPKILDMGCQGRPLEPFLHAKSPRGEADVLKQRGRDALTPRRTAFIP